MKNFVFTSAGDKSCLQKWLGPNANYDLYTIYYGDDPEKYRQIVPWLECRKGSKFQNFKYFYQTYPEIINQYDRFFIVDDDIIMTPDQINQMFDFARQYNLDICGPSFTSQSKISHQINRHNPNLIMAYTNFIEVNAMLFSKPALDQLMVNLNPRLIGWGIDYLAIWTNGLMLKNNYAINHLVAVTNPTDLMKGGTRELNLIASCNRRAQIWRETANEIGCPVNFPLKEYQKIVKPSHSNLPLKMTKPVQSLTNKSKLQTTRSVQTLPNKSILHQNKIHIYRSNFPLKTITTRLPPVVGTPTNFHVRKNIKHDLAGY